MVGKPGAGNSFCFSVYSLNRGTYEGVRARLTFASEEQAAAKTPSRL